MSQNFNPVSFVTWESELEIVLRATDHMWREGGEQLL